MSTEFMSVKLFSGVTKMYRMRSPMFEPIFDHRSQYFQGEPIVFGVFEDDSFYVPAQWRYYERPLRHRLGWRH